MAIYLDLGDIQLVELLLTLPRNCGWQGDTFDCCDVILTAERLGIVDITTDNFSKAYNDIKMAMESGPGGKYATVFTGE